MGVLLPARATASVGASESTYHHLAGIGGGLAGLVCVAGFGVLAFRRTTINRIRGNHLTRRRGRVRPARDSAPAGRGYPSATTCSAPGTTIARRSARGFAGSCSIRTSDYGRQPRWRTSVTRAIPWLLYAVWPFSRLVHAWSYPLQYFNGPTSSTAAVTPAPDAEPRANLVIRWKTSHCSGMCWGRFASSQASSSPESHSRLRGVGSTPNEIAVLLGLARIGAVLVGSGMLAVLGFGLWLVDLGDWGYGAGWVDAAIGLFAAAALLGGLGGHQKTYYQSRRSRGPVERRALEARRLRMDRVRRSRRGGGRSRRAPSR